MAEQEFLNYASDDGGNVSVPRKLRAGRNTSDVELAYITPEEYQILIDIANDSAEMPDQSQVMANQGGLMRTGYALGSEYPVIPSKDGMQLDMRDTGGYQPHGAQEKKDDVRALLAQGEFVMTSDAVRGMGGGDREVGAKKMYNLMHNMEAMA